MRSVATQAHRRPAVTAAAAALALAAVCFCAAPARAAEPDPRAPSVLTATATPGVAAFGGSAELSGRLDAAGAGVAGAVLTVDATTDGAGWHAAGETTTAGDGSYSLRVTPGPEWAGVTYRVSFAGDAARQPAQATVVVGVQAELTPPSVPRTVGRGTTFTVTGDLRPAHAGGAAVGVRCYRLDSGQWVDLAGFDGSAAAAAGGSSPFACNVRLPSAGTWRLRTFHEDAAHAASWSDWSARITVTAGRDQPVWDRDGVTTLPELMASRFDARQLVVVTGSRLGSRNGTLRLFDYEGGDWVQRLSAPAQFGSNGLSDGLARHAGSRTTPTGIWRMATFAFGTHAAAPRGCGLAWRHITPRSWWSAEHGAAYNTWVETARRVNGEHLADYPQAYELAVHSGYNALPNRRVFGRGTAIFIHVDHAGYSAGCITLARRDVVSLLRLLKGGAHLACAVGVTRAGRPTSITAY